MIYNKMFFYFINFINQMCSIILKFNYLIIHFYYIIIKFIIYILINFKNKLFFFIYIIISGGALYWLQLPVTNKFGNHLVTGYHHKISKNRGTEL